MTPNLIRELLDACFYGKQIIEKMPALPLGMKPRHLHVLHAVEILSAQDIVRISDVSKVLRTTMPSITKLINELEELDTLIKNRAYSKDHRVTTVNLTPLGKKYVAKYIHQYHCKLAELLSSLNEQDCRTTVHTLKIMAQLMEKHPIQFKL
ncbi:MarR family winged helix-turn-helix transcriptional regulator [Pectinatus haikarae]|uniref:MarR family winged helix-turn-helix transcriptional regulator n=1 Tax=Pectinatus haikarae TaxID=349096 RepID=UPI0018C5F5AA|nr:MarR family winged helix-turn-helix transcriptional regulator [Pectinatus haikarae]